MITEQTNYYCRFPDEIEDRIDFRYNHYCFNKFVNIITASKDYHKFQDVIPEDGIIMGTSSPYSEEGDIRFITGDNVGIDKFDLSIKYYISREEHSANLRSKVETGDLLFSVRGEYIGKVVVIPEYLEESNIINNLVRIIVDKSKANPEYLEYFIKSNLGRAVIEKNTWGGAQPGFTNKNIREMDLILPLKNKQDIIVESVRPLEIQALDYESKSQEYLDKASKILLNELGIELADEKMSYFFKEGRQNSSDYYHRFNEEIGDRFHYLFNHPKLEILDKLKNKYQTVSLKNTCRESIRRGEQPEYSELGVMVIKTVDLKNRFIDCENALRVSQDFYESKPRGHIQKNDILVSSTGYVSVGKIDVFGLEEPAFADGHISIVRLNDDYDPYFLTYFLRSPLGQIQFEKWFTGSSGQIEVQPEDLNKFILPSEDEISHDKQKEIADKITEEYEKARDYEQRAQFKRQEAKELFEKLILEAVENVQKE